MLTTYARVLLDINLTVTSIRMFFSKINFLLNFDLEARHSCISLKLSRIKFSSYAELSIAFIAFDSEDHEHVCFSSLGYVIVGQMDRLDSLAFGQWPLNLLHTIFKVHA